MDSRKNGFLTTISQLKTALRNYLQISFRVVETYNELGRSDVLRDHKVAHQVSSVIRILSELEDKYHCPLCGNHFDSFQVWSDKYDFDVYNFEMYNKYTAICPICFSSDRERLYKLYIEKETEIQLKPHSVLHIAPELNLRNWILDYSNINYICGDLFPADSITQKIDITQIPYEDETFDVVLCSHVLEHIPNDHAGMSDLYRVLKKGGWGILQVPIALNIEDTYEDFSIVTPKERLKHFGQEDHVRIYSKQDYIARLKKVGFVVETFNFAKKYGIYESMKYGLSEQLEKDILYVVHKQ